MNNELLEAVQSALWMIAQGLLTIALPVLAAYALQFARQKVAEIRLGLSETENERIGKVIQFAVVATEQLKANGLIPDGQSAKAYALDIVQRELQRVNIPVDVHLLSDKIEAGYRDQIGGFGFYSKSELLDKAVEIAVDAMIDSGSIDEAKEQASALAEKYLKEYGVSIDFDVLQAAVSAKFKQAAAAKPTQKK